MVNTFLLVRCGGGGGWAPVTTYVRIIGPILRGERILIQGMTPPVPGQGAESHERNTHSNERNTKTKEKNIYQ